MMGYSAEVAVERAKVVIGFYDSKFKKGSKDRGGF